MKAIKTRTVENDEGEVSTLLLIKDDGPNFCYRVITLNHGTGEAVISYSMDSYAEAVGTLMNDVVAYMDLGYATTTGWDNLIDWATPY